MANLNKVMLIGNLTRDPQLSYLPSQTPVVELGMAINRRWTGQDGNQREEVCYVDLQAFGRQAETLNKYCSKGSPLFVEGRLNYQTWTAQDGSKRSRLRVTVENFQFLGSGGGGGQGGHGDSGGAARSSAPSQEAYGQPSSEPGPIPTDDIPF